MIHEPSGRTDTGFAARIRTADEQKANKTMKKLLYVWMLAALAGCTSDEWPAEPDWDRIPDPSVPVDDGLMKPAECDNTVVAHRGGSSECGAPDNSIASLRYAMECGCYGSECDIYWTKDDRIVVAHADGDCKVNNIQPWTATLAELRAAGRLSNGEELPALEDLIRTVMVDGNCTRLMLDIKKIDKPVAQTEYVINAARRACEIVTEMGAKHFVELVCTGYNGDVMKIANGYAKKAGLSIGMNSGKSGAEYGTLGFGWANLSAAGNMSMVAGGSGQRTLEEYEKAGVALSVYNVDRQSGDGNAVYSESAVDYYVANYARFRSLCSNYPKWLIGRIDAAYKTYDGIQSQADFEAFAASLESDAFGTRFANADGAVVLKTDLNLASFVPLSVFRGVFDGNGRTITVNYRGDDTQAGLFKTLYGTVKNLTLAGRFESTRTDDKEVHLGAIAARAYGATIENCVNKAAIAVHNGDDAASRCMILSGMVAKVWDGVTLRNCTNEGAISFASPAYCLIGGMVGAINADDGVSTISGCTNTADIENASRNNTDWCYVGGIVAKPTSGLLLLNGGADYRLTVGDCSFTGTIALSAGSKVRGAGIAAYAKGTYRISGCSFDGAILCSDGTVRDVVLGGMMGYAETTCDGFIEKCSFGGTIKAAVDGGNYYFGGIFGNNGSGATVVADCTASGTAYIGYNKGKSVGMLAGRPHSDGFTIRDCRIAGTVDNGGAEIVIGPDNLEEWMFRGTATSKKITLENNGYNNEK